MIRSTRSLTYNIKLLCSDAYAARSKYVVSFDGTKSRCRAITRVIVLHISIYLVDPAKEASFGHRLSHASVSSVRMDETANSSLYYSEPI